MAIQNFQNENSVVNIYTYTDALYSFSYEGSARGVKTKLTWHDVFTATCYLPGKST